MSKNITELFNKINMAMPAGGSSGSLQFAPTSEAKNMGSLSFEAPRPLEQRQTTIGLFPGEMLQPSSIFQAFGGTETAAPAPAPTGPIIPGQPEMKMGSNLTMANPLRNTSNVRVIA
ncbi:MAG: hypothetical protein V4721_00435 [Bacteroidota bacterium]